MQSEKRTIAVDGRTISYTLLIKNVKNVNMSLSERGEITVSANAYCPKNKIDDFVKSKVDWLLKKQKAVQRRNEVFYHRDDTVLHFLGKSYPIRKVKAAYESVKLNEKECVVYLSEDEHGDALIRDFLVKQCKRIFMEEVESVYTLMKMDYNLPVPKIKIREMNSRWGSCTPSKALISLNFRCIYYPREFLRYVVIHEFAHFIQPNHSKQFYHVVEKYMPDYKRASKLYDAGIGGADERL